MAQFTWHQKEKLQKASSEHIPLCSVTEVQLRFLCPDDLAEVQTLCQDWFPIDYPLTWYEDITSSSRFFALAAVYNLAIIGLIVAEIKPYSKLHKEDRSILPECMARNAEVGYILSLGVDRQHRRNGIGSLLLDSLINHLTTAERNTVKAIFLHVLTTNQAAILFYERRRFYLHSFLPYYYVIKGKSKDGFTYVSYINGGHPPGSLLLKILVPKQDDPEKYLPGWRLKCGRFFVGCVIKPFHDLISRIRTFSDILNLLKCNNVYLNQK